MDELGPEFVELQLALAGRYSIERELGRGGMGTVYLARDVSLDRLVAIKVLPRARAGDPKVRARFLAEARTAARLSHPNIVPIHAVEELGELVYFVMAFVPGRTLGERLRQGGPLPAGESARLLREVAWALDYAHQQGVVHRDVKADNILLDPATRRALVADFGIAAALGQPGRGDGVAGTVPYMSPEQALGNSVDGRSDIYSLGALGYLVLSGRLPYAAGTIEQLLGLQAQGGAAPLSRLTPQVPRALCRAVDRCLSLAPEARFQTAAELADALDQLVAAPTELPAPLRVWLTRDQRGRWALLLWTALMAVPTIFMFAALGNPYGPPAAAVASVLLLSFGPWAGYLAGRILRTRQVLRAGYTHADLLLAIQAESDRRREELAFEIGRVTPLGRLIRAGTWVSIGMACLTAVLPWAGFGFFGVSWAAFASLGMLGALAGFFIPGRDLPAKPKVSLRARFWRGSLGKLITRVAGWRLGRAAAPDVTFHRPTEIALGDAAGALFQALPPAHRRDLADLPVQIAALSKLAQDLRRRIEELDDLIAQAAPTTLVEGLRAPGDGGAGPLTEARAQISGQLTETVAMLETLRIGLLKLHAGSQSVQGLAVDLSEAGRLGRRVAELHAVERDLDSMLGSGDRPSGTES